MKVVSKMSIVESEPLGGGDNGRPLLIGGGGGRPLSIPLVAIHDPI
jgi:hypothetical protein